MIGVGLRQLDLAFDPRNAQGEPLAAGRFTDFDAIDLWAPPLNADGALHPGIARRKISHEHARRTERVA